jgi:predicted nucleotidyltransferase
MYAIHTEGFDAALTLTDHIDHLPDRKRRELARIIEILFAGVEKFHSTKLSEKRNAGKILKVILYGSYARGDWVEDRVSGYRSDYDLLIVVNSKAFAEEHELWQGIENELLDQQLSRRIETPVVPIVHDLNDVNDQLSRGRPILRRCRQGRRRSVRVGRTSPRPTEALNSGSRARRETSVL